MGTIVDITQYKLDRALDSEEVAAKIKLRRLSHANLVEHVKNIPYMAVKGPKIKSSKFTLPSEQKELSVSPKKYIQMITGSYRPINVKEDKTENIRRHSDILVSMAIEKEPIEEVQTVPVEMPIVEENFDLQNVKSNDVFQTEVSVTETTVNDEKIVDINEYVTRIENETQLLKKIKEEALLAQQEADASDETVSKLSVEVSELEKQEAEVERKNSELDQQIIAAYEEQSKIQALNRKEFNHLIEEANARKKVNEDKIIQFNSKKDDIRNRITLGNENIARKQGVLAGVQQTEFSNGNNIVQIPNTDEVIQFTDESEEKVKRMA